MTPRVIEGEIAGGLVQERFDMLDRPRVDRLPRAQEGFLREVLRRLPITHDPHQGPHQGVALCEKCTREARSHRLPLRTEHKAAYEMQEKTSTTMI